MISLLSVKSLQENFQFQVQDNTFTHKKDILIIEAFPEPVVNFPTTMISCFPIIFCFTEIPSYTHALICCQMIIFCLVGFINA